MLILTRRIGEKINIGDDIVIMVGDVKGNQAKLCIAAPQHIKVYREEIYNKIQNETIPSIITVRRSKLTQTIEKGNHYE